MLRKFLPKLRHFLDNKRGGTMYRTLGIIVLTCLMSISMGTAQESSNGDIESSFINRNTRQLPESKQLKDMFIKVQRGIVYCYSGNSKTTGIFVSKDGWVLTAGHKVDRDFPDAHTIHVKLIRTSDAKVFKSTKILPLAKGWDLLLFKIDYKPKFYFKRFIIPHLLQENWIFGFRLTSGKVPSNLGYITHSVDFPNLLLTTASIIFGNSGSPVLSRDGNVLGILVRGYQFGDGFFISAMVVKEYIKTHLK